VRRLLALALVSLAAATPRIAAASPAAADPPVGVALAAGAATALLPLAIGVAHTAEATTFASRNAGFMVAGAGFALSPIVAHVVLGEWGRAAAFGAAPLAAEIGMITLTTVEPGAIFGATKGTRTAFGFMFSVGAFSAALGLIDVALARDRARERLPKALRGLTLTPTIGPGTAGLFLGGTL
jgi:hypothetical protein